MSLRKRYLAAPLLCALGSFSWPQSSLAQQAPTVIQLPTFSFFTVSTTVVVPDNGGAYMGGFRRASAGRSRYGAPLLPGQGAAGANCQAGGLHVSATIHDHQELDKRTLGDQPLASRAKSELAEQLAQNRDSAAAGLASVSEIRQARGNEELAQADEVERILAQARAMEEQGKPNVARIHYQMAARRTSGAQQAKILATIARLTRPADPKVVAR